MAKHLLALLSLLTVTGCFTQKEAAVVDNKDKFYSRAGASKYIVLAHGQSLNFIAKKYGITEAELVNLNRLKSPTDIKPGMTLAIPASASATSSVSTENTTTGYRPVYADGSGSKESNMGYFYSKKTTVTEKTTESGSGSTDAAKLPASSWSKDPEISEQKLTDIDTPVAAVTAASTKPAKAEHEPVKLSAAEASRELEIEKEEQQLSSKEPEKPAAKVATRDKDFKVPAPINSKRFEWPVHGKILSRYGNNANKFNDGINIAAASGTPVTAASEGKVAYIGNNIEGYGNLVILKHDNDIMTAYAHLDDIAVERGAQVKKGESIGTVGKSGNITQPQLHFSVRKGKKTVDPEVAN